MIIVDCMSVHPRFQRRSPGGFYRSQVKGDAMKQKLSTNLLLMLKLIFIFPVLLLGAQKITPFRDLTAASPVYAQNAVDPGTPGDSGGGEYHLPDVPDLTAQQRQDIQKQIDSNIQRMGIASRSDIAPMSTLLSWPIRGASGLTDTGYHGIGAFVDHNPANPNQLLDYSCGTRTYDISGYNHAGTDIFSWPFGWYKMDHNEVEIIAAAPGTIILKQDGNSDRSCAMNNNPWNAVYIRHADGTVAWYGHMKKGSLTTKQVGDIVNTGEYLGIVGSSGSSTGPHLHFELHDSSGNVIDPWAGACNTISSMWAAQRPYYDSAINSMMTGSAAPVFPTCPTTETKNSKDQFYPGDTVYFSTYYRDQQVGQQTTYTIYLPDGTVYQTWARTATTYFSASYWYWSFNLGANVPAGRWKYEAVYDGKTYQHDFSVGDSVSLHAQPRDKSIQLTWDVTGSLTPGSTWQITYTGPAGTQVSPIALADGTTRAFTLTGLTNYTTYTINLQVMVSGIPVRTTTVTVMPSDIFVNLPFIFK
jgi:hypothetical protein